MSEDVVPHLSGSAVSREQEEAILVVDDEQDDVVLVEPLVLKRHGWQVRSERRVDESRDSMLTERVGMGRARKPFVESDTVNLVGLVGLPASLLYLFYTDSDPPHRPLRRVADHAQRRLTPDRAESKSKFGHKAL